FRRDKRLVVDGLPGGSVLVGCLEGLVVGLLVAFPANEQVVLEPDRKAALLGVSVPRFVIVRVVPAVGMKGVLQRGRAQYVAYLLAGHALFKASHLLGSNPVALLYVGAIGQPPLGAAASSIDDSLEAYT